MANIRPANNPFSAGLGEMIEDDQGNLWHKSRKTGKLRVINTVEGSIVRVIGGPGQRVVVPSANNISTSTTIKDAADLITNTTNFAGKLSTADTNVQLALDTLDDHVHVHSTNTSLTADDHTQYALLLGRAGGQSLSGGTAANDDLTLQGTTNATRTTSYVLLQPTAGNVGIGTLTPAAPLDVAGTVRSFVSGASVSFVAYNPGSSYPRGQMLVGYGAPITNAVFIVAPGDSSTGVSYPMGLEIDMNQNAADASNRLIGLLQTASYASIYALGPGGNSAGTILSFSTRTYLGNNSGLVINNDTNQTVNIGTDTLSTIYQLNVIPRSTLHAAYFGGNVGILIAPTARLHLPAGTATASTAPLKITTGGTVLTTAEAGAIETAGDLLYYTIPTGPTRKTIAFTTDIVDKLASVSANDTTPGYLNGKLVAGTGVTLTEGSDGGNETLTIAQAGKVIHFGTAASGSSTAYTVTTTPSFASNADKTLVLWTADVANSTPTPTLACNGLTARTLTKNNFSTLAVGEIKVGGIYLCAYDGTNNYWQILSHIGV